ncbi:MAG: carbohydrate binding family 9 domain-containing protein [Gemmatimonadota bacterium]|jgi:hypothetical protein|nr:carbohydrate binding family 9 domain-containing protein [Gemmatimonadota bacterium]
MRRSVVPLFSMIALGCFAAPLRSQEPGVVRLDPLEATGASDKQARAVRIEHGTISLDGALNEAVWSTAPAVVDFRQKEPDEGAEPTSRMEVRFVYDDDALYIGARMYSQNPGAIQAPLGRRDQDSEITEHIRISLDTFHDRRTAYSFGVTANGVRIDSYHGTDSESGDSGFNPVWEAKTRIDDQGWTAELWIPYTQLRFNAVDDQVWGLNISRVIPTLQEEVYWVVVPRTERGWASRFGELRGISAISPTRRIEMLPFVVGSTTMNANRDRANPFDDGKNLLGRVGLDMKMGLGPNLTLDATLNPDFGQVEADPAEVNLTAFATRFSERRPFFTEGSDLLSISHPNVFYSRRIGSPPAGRVSGDFVDQPINSAVIGAAKITGRLRNGYSIGVLTAVTGDESARAYSLETGEITETRVQPYAGYGVARIQKDLGNGSYASVLLGGVRRQFSGDDDPMRDLLVANSLVYAGDTFFRLHNGQYEATIAAVGSWIGGEAAAMRRVQMSSAHYMQRPDKDYAQLDPNRTSMSGFSTQASFNRVGGRHWLFGTSIKIDTPAFETNEIAQLNGADGIQPGANITYRETTPGKIFRSYSLRVSQGMEWNWGGDRQTLSTGSTLNLTWKNFWRTTVQSTRNFRTQSATLTRGGPLMGSAAAWSGSLAINSPSSSSRTISTTLSASSDELGGWSRGIRGSLAFRPHPRWQLSASPNYSRARDSQQYVTTLSGGREEVYGSRYIFSYINRTTISTQVRAGFTVRPDLNFDLYMEPFAASGRYFDYGELSAPGSIDRVTYGAAGTGTTMVVNADGSREITAGGDPFTISNRDFNQKSYNSNAVLRWEWRPGSTMYLVWQQNRSARDPISNPVDLGDPFKAITLPGTNILLFKTSWWLPVR